jgi:8-oxo-dGTP diphosphatase
MNADLESFPRPHLAVDVVLLTLLDGALHVLLLARDEEPHRGTWVLPGGFVRVEESIDSAVARVLADKAGLTDVFVEQLYTFGEPARDARGRIVSVAHYALVPASRLDTRAEGTRLARVAVPWKGLTGGPAALQAEDGSTLPVGFDHSDIVGLTVQRLRGKIDYAPVGFELLPREFTLLELQRVHEAVLGTRLNKDSFRRRMLASGQLAATGRKQRDVGHRPAELFRFRRPRGGGARTGGK